MDRMKKIKIIVCESLDPARQFVRHSLEDYFPNFSIEVASNGKNIKKRLEMNHYDLVIYEREMPELSGDDLLKWVRSHQALRNMPVIMLSTNREAESLKMAVMLGVNAYIIKPFTAEGLIEKVKEVLEL